MKQNEKSKIGRRDFLCAVGGGVGLAVTAAVPFSTEVEAAESHSEERKARYQANSSDVQNYYRVNRYPQK